LADAEAQYTADRDLILAAAREAGRIALAFRDKGMRAWEKSKGDPVSEADIAADTYLQGALKPARPEYGWLSEETADDKSRLSAERSFVVDPIDGTRAFLKGRPEFVVSIGVVEAGRPVAAAIYDPSEDVMWDAVIGCGARRDGAAISVSSATSLSGARLMGDPGRLPGVRALGATAETVNSVALRLARVADGTFDGLIAERPKWDWDLAAGALLITEAGGYITGRKGAPLQFNEDPPRQPAPLAAGPALHALLRERLSQGDL
jgi:myo-inositol-1(or 4)-monophosphatase